MNVQLTQKPVVEAPPRTPAKPAAKPRLSREEIAAIEVGHTDISPALARLLVIVFLSVITIVPITQNAMEFLEIRKGKADAAKAGKQYSGRHLPQSFDGLRILPKRAEIAGLSGFDALATMNTRMLKDINEFEDALESNSVFQQNLIPPVQFAVTGLLKGGNEKAYCGEARWLFYRPGVDYLTARGFLRPEVLNERSKSGNEWTAPPQPDPVKAILHFKEQLAARGIELIVMPTPVKPTVHPEKFSGRFSTMDKPLQNPSFDRFVKHLEGEGVHVFDAAPALVDLKQRSGKDVYLETDTHWTPAAMQFVAGTLPAYMKTRGIGLPERPHRDYLLRKKAIKNLGDIAFMLKLPQNQTFYPEQEVTITEVLSPDGKLWAADESAEVLLLGDSFTNIYSLGGMNWGQSAGFAEHLSAALGRPIDRIAMNDSGAFATRLSLSRELARGEDRLAGKKVVVWQFAARELSVGDWKLLDMSLGESKVARAPLAADGVVLKGKVSAMPKPPVPGKVPYRDAIVGIHLTELNVVSGTFDTARNEEVLVYMWVMRDNKLTSVASFAAGQEVTVKVAPWDMVKAKVGRFTRLEIDDPMVLMLDAFWGEE